MLLPSERPTAGPDDDSDEGLAGICESEYVVDELAGGAVLTGPGATLLLRRRPT